MSQNSAKDSEHPKPVTPDLAPASARGKAMFQGLSASSVGLEFGLSVVIGALFGRWLDGKAGTDPWLMIGFLCLGFVAGIRGIMRAMKRMDKESA
ncbi:MAG TPA: AtpZ/AtpI family protein [Kofleriaceae bacterium]|jgi:ATP synthase protein I